MYQRSISKAIAAATAQSPGSDASRERKVAMRSAKRLELVSAHAVARPLALQRPPLARRAESSSRFTPTFAPMTFGPSPVVIPLTMLKSVIALPCRAFR